MSDIKDCPRCLSRLADTKSNGRSEPRGAGRSEWVEGDQFWVHCPACGFNGPVRRTATDALKAWNRTARQGAHRIARQSL